MRCLAMALVTCWPTSWKKQSRQKAALWRRTSMTTAPRQRLQRIAMGSRSPGDREADLDLVAVAQLVLAGEQRPVADHQHRARQHVQVTEQVGHAADVGHLDGPVRWAQTGGDEHG